MLEWKEKWKSFFVLSRLEKVFTRSPQGRILSLVMLYLGYQFYFVTYIRIDDSEHILRNLVRIGDGGIIIYLSAI